RIGDRRPGPAGKPGYVAPEAMGGRSVSASEDVYAWAVVVVECLLGRRLFMERDLSEAATREGPPPAVAQRESPTLPNVGPLLSRALALDEGRRPKLAELRAEIDQVVTDRGALAETVARVQAAGEPRPGERLSRLPLPAPPSAPAAAPSPRELTPTAPAPVVTLLEPEVLTPAFQTSLATTSAPIER